MMGRPPRLTEADIPRVRAIMATMERPTRRKVCTALGVPLETFRSFLRRYDTGLFPKQCAVASRANGLAGTLFQTAYDLGINGGRISHEIGCSRNTLLNWRRGKGIMPLFAAQCFADLVGLQLVLIPKEPK